MQPSKKSKILFVITKSNWGGAQRYVYNLATSLPTDAFEVGVALGGTGLAGSGPGELARRLSAAHIPTTHVASFARDVAFLSDFGAMLELVRLFKKERPDVVHLNSSKAGGVGALAARLASLQTGHPATIVFTSHGLVWDEDRNSAARALIKFFSWVTFLLVHKVIVISKDNYVRAKALPFCANKIHLVYSGLPELQFESREKARVSLAVKIGLTEYAGAFWVGTIAELTKNKGLPYLIQAINVLAGNTVSASGSTTNKSASSNEYGVKLPAVHLFIIGSGEEEQNLKKQITELGLEGVVHMVGFVSDAYRYDNAFDVFTLSSVKEGLPTVLLEAGQAGVPVVATNISGAQDIVEDGTSGLLVPTKDPQAIANALLKLIEDTRMRKTLAENLQQKVAQTFSIERMVEGTIEIYQ